MPAKKPIPACARRRFSKSGDGSKQRSHRGAEVEIGWYSREVVSDEIALDITGLLRQLTLQLLTALFAHDDQGQQEGQLPAGADDGEIIKESLWVAAEVAVVGFLRWREVAEHEALHGLHRFTGHLSGQVFSAGLADRRLEDHFFVAVDLLDLVEAEVF